MMTVADHNNATTAQPAPTDKDDELSPFLICPSEQGSDKRNPQNEKLLHDNMSVGLFVCMSHCGNGIPIA